MENNQTQMDYQVIMSLLNKIQNRLSSLESKMDKILSRNSGQAPVHQPKPPVVSHPQAVSQPQPQQPAAVAPQQNAPQQQGRKRERPMFKVICAECNKECEVPFKPTAERPVYCRECYALRRKGGNAPQPVTDKIVKDVTQPPVITKIEWHDDAPQAPDPKKDVAAKKKPAQKQKAQRKASPRKQQKKNK